MTARGDMQQWDLAGLTGEDGVLGRPVQATEIFIPAMVDLDGDRLVWRATATDGENRRRAVVPEPGLLNAFVRLAKGSDEAILRYARKWGVLYVCEHGLPASHNPRPWPPETGSGCYPLGWDGGGGWEHLNAWRRFAGEALETLNIAASLHQGRKGDPERWALADYASGLVWNTTIGSTDTGELTVKKGWIEAKTLPWYHSPIGTQRKMIQNKVNEWLRLGGPEPSFFWSENGPRIGFGGGALFGTLALQLMVTIARSTLTTCSECHQPYIPVMSPRADRRHYCPDCGIKAAWRYAQHKQRHPEGQQEVDNG